MKRYLVPLLVCVLSAIYCKEKLQNVPYPEKYKEWTLLKSALIQAGEPHSEILGGIHHIYANGKAASAMQAGEKLPDGSVLIFDLYESVSTDSGEGSGAHKFLGVMHKDTASFPETGGWGYEAFKGDTQERLVKDAKSMCFSCHEPQKDRDFVFTTMAQ